MCVVPASSQASLFASAHAALLATLTLLIKESATVTVHKEHRRTAIFVPGIISLFIMCIEIELIPWQADAPGLRFEPWLLSASRSTAHSKRVLWPLGYMSKCTEWHCYIKISYWLPWLMNVSSIIPVNCWYCSKTKIYVYHLVTERYADCMHMLFLETQVHTIRVFYTSMLVLLNVGPKCTLAALHTAPSEPPWVCWQDRDRRAYRQIDGYQMVTLHFTLYTASVIIYAYASSYGYGAMKLSENTEYFHLSNMIVHATVSHHAQCV